MDDSLADTAEMWSKNDANHEALVSRLTRWIGQAGWVRDYEHARVEAEAFVRDFAEAAPPVDVERLVRAIRAAPIRDPDDRSYWIGSVESIAGKIAAAYNAEVAATAVERNVSEEAILAILDDAEERDEDTIVTARRIAALATGGPVGPRRAKPCPHCVEPCPLCSAVPGTETHD